MRAGGLPGLKLSLSVDGSNLHEHQTEIQDSDIALTATTYVEAVAGAAFVINIALEPGFKYRRDQLKLVVYLDGSRIRHKFVNLGRGSKIVKIEKINETVGGQRTIRRFLFAEHQTSMRKATH